MSAMRPYESLLDALAAAGRECPPDRRLLFLEDRAIDEVPYAAAWSRSLARAAALRADGVEREEPVLLLVPTSSDFLYAFFGLLMAGAVPSALAPPAGYGAAIDFADRTARIARYLGARRVVTTSDYREVIASVLPEARILLVEPWRGLEAPSGFEPARPKADDLALLQCTSGSTGTPKGVMLTHGNLLANVHGIGESLAATSADVPVCWLPLYHDMGLIGCLLFAVYHGMKGVFLSPFRFLRRPVSWLAAISEHRGTISPAPNFAYRYATARVKDAELAGLDLSSWRAPLCGSEPVDRRTIEAFETRFAPCRLPAPCVAPCYGLAESSLAVTFHPLLTPLSSDRVSRAALTERGEVVHTADDDALEVVDCGAPMPGARVRIVDDEGREVPEGRLGHIEVSGPSVMKGYWRLEEETRATLREGWLTTGDLGYLRSGGLRIAGRRKDLVILRGRKFPPTDFEWAASEVPGVRSGNVVAFGLYDDAQGTETLHLVCEIDTGDPEDVARRVRERVAERTGILPAAVEMVPRNTVPKTTSGKLQRGRMREMYLAMRGRR